MEMHINGIELLNYLKMVKVFSPKEWDRMERIQIGNVPLMSESFSFLEELHDG